jgi:hypothetical protein
MSRLLTYALDFRGAASHEGDHLVFRASAPSCGHETRLRRSGVVTRLVSGDCTEEPLLESRLVLDRGGRFMAAVAVDFGHGHRLWGETLDPGRLARSVDEHLRHGTATIHVVGGSGQFDGASGELTSNFVVSHTGELTDNQLGVVFLQSAG